MHGFPAPSSTRPPRITMSYSGSALGSCADASVGSMHEIARIMPMGRIFWIRFMIFLAAQMPGTNFLIAPLLCVLFPVPTESCSLLLGCLLEQVQAAPAIVMRASCEDRIEQTHG